MNERPEATVRPVEEAEATGRVAAIFEDIKATKKIDFVPRFWRVLATDPDHLEMIWTRLKAIMHPEALGRSEQARPPDPRDHRAGGLGTNGCPYCVQSHTAAVRKLGLGAEALGAR